MGWLLAALACLLAQAGDGASLLIRNVRLIDRDDQTRDVVVSILIRNRELHVVTRDAIPASEATLVLDARNGVLLGKLHLGEPPSFLILDQDPRETVAVLLDTRTHARFAIHDGKILKNELREVTGAELEPPRRGWLAYTPPPLALPLSYRDESKWNRWEGRYVSGILVGALLLDRQRWISQDDPGEGQVGDLDEFDGGEIRGFRVGAVGTLNFEKPWVYTVFVATNAFSRGFDSERDDDLTFYDYRLDIPLPREVTLSVGKQKEPISMERIMSLAFLPMQERSSAADALLPARNFGVVLSGSGLGRRMSWAAGAFNDWLDEGGSFNDNSSQMVARLTGLPFLSPDESNLVHLGLGLRYSDAEEGARALTEPEFNNAPFFVDTGLLRPEDTMQYNVELSWRKGPLWVSGEYNGARVDSPPLGDPSFSGYHVAGSWALSGEMRRYNRQGGIFGPLPVSRSVYQGGWGAWELGLRWSELDLSDGPVEGGEMEILSAGVGWWLSPVFNLNLNYRHVRLDRLGDQGRSDGVNVRLVLMLE
jgi:phosphate-selective porin OprO/OprP